MLIGVLFSLRKNSRPNFTKTSRYEIKIANIAKIKRVKMLLTSKLMWFTKNIIPIIHNMWQTSPIILQ